MSTGEFVLRLTAKEKLALQLLAAIGTTGLSTPVGPGHELKRRIETKHNQTIEVEDITSVLAKLGDDVVAK